MAVELGDRAAGLRERARALGAVVGGDLRAVDLAGDHDGLGGAAQRIGKPGAVSPHRLLVVAGEDAEVEALEGSGAEPSHAGGEGGPGAGKLRLEPADFLLLAPAHPRKPRL